eukprot:1152626-Pelagomonas_calceolata.AAC.1
MSVPSLAGGAEGGMEAIATIRAGGMQRSMSAFFSCLLSLGGRSHVLSRAGCMSMSMPSPAMGGLEAIATTKVVGMQQSKGCNACLLFVGVPVLGQRVGSMA